MLSKHNVNLMARSEGILPASSAHDGWQRLQDTGHAQDLLCGRVCAKQTCCVNETEVKRNDCHIYLSHPNISQWNLRRPESTQPKKHGHRLHRWQLLNCTLTARTQRMTPAQRIHRSPYYFLKTYTTFLSEDMLWHGSDPLWHSDNCPPQSLCSISPCTSSSYSSSTLLTYLLSSASYHIPSSYIPWSPPPLHFTLEKTALCIANGSYWPYEYFPLSMPLPFM
jgi:hypothetical protein